MFYIKGRGGTSISRRKSAHQGVICQISRRKSAHQGVICLISRRKSARKGVRIEEHLFIVIEI